MIVQVIKDGPKNFSVLVRGFAATYLRPQPIIDLKNIKAPTEGWKGLRLDAALWAIQEKMGLYLWWGAQGTPEETLALIMESRNSMRFDEGIPSPRMNKGWDGTVLLSNFLWNKPDDMAKAYFVLLDFDKQ